MSKYEVTKSVEAAKLNKRTGIALTEHPTTIPYGAIISDIQEDRDHLTFAYMGDRYTVKRDIFASAYIALGGVSTGGGTAAGPATQPAVAVVDDERPMLQFESLRVNGAGALSRARVPGGWLVAGNGSVTFVPDALHEWNGGSLG